MSQTKHSVRWTIQDVEALPENEWVRYEIVDGELFVTRSPHHKHQHVIGCLFAALNDWSLARRGGSFICIAGLRWFFLKVKRDCQSVK
jgi:Uma2 family endonuclease